MQPGELTAWLETTDPERLRELWARADATRHEHVGDEVHLRGLVEISNHCRRHCTYCGLRADRPELERYRMDAEEILTIAHLAVRLGFGSLVLQSGEDPRLGVEFLEQVVRRIKALTPLAVTLSLGERSVDELARLRQAGADRYLLRFESSNRELFARIHPPGPSAARSRMELLAELRRLGYEVGSGVMVGIPGTSLEDLQRDLLTFRELGLDMIGVGPYIPHPATPMGSNPDQPDTGPTWSRELMTYNVIALSRLLCPRANIPATTALDALWPADGRELALCRGANVWMPNLTPLGYRARYEIYPRALPCDDSPERHVAEIARRLAALGRRVGRGPGASPSFADRRALGD